MHQGGYATLAGVCRSVSKRLVVLSALVAVLSYAASAWALGFGDIRIDSTLNEPLDATIDLVSLSEAERNSLSVGVAGPDMFQRFGIERSALADELRVQRRSAPGSDHVVVHLTTRRPVREPFLRFLIEANTNSGKALREYTVLLDPPGRSPTRSVDAPTPRLSTRGSESVARASRSAPSRQRAGVSGNSYGPVRGGETLYKIAARTKRPGTTQDQRQVAIFRANPEAFGASMNVLMKGATLTIPTAGQMAAIDTGEARAQILAQRRTDAPAPADNDSNVATTRDQSKARRRASNATAPPATTDATLRLEPPSGEYASDGALFGRLVEADFAAPRSRASETAARAVGALVMAGRADAFDDLDFARPAPEAIDAGKQIAAAGDGVDAVTSTASGDGSEQTAAAAGAADAASQPLSAADTDVAGGAGFGLLKPSTLMLVLALLLLIGLLLVWNRRRQYKPVPLDFGADEQPQSPAGEAPAQAMAAAQDRQPEGHLDTPITQPTELAAPAVAPSVRIHDADRQMKIGLFDQARSTLEAGLAQTPEDAGLQDKLLELDYLSGDTAAFASDVGRFGDALATNGVRWAGVAAMGRLLLPGDPRFAAPGHRPAPEIESPAVAPSMPVPALSDKPEPDNDLRAPSKAAADSDPEPAHIPAPAASDAFDEPTPADRSADEQISEERSDVAPDAVFDLSDYDGADDELSLPPDSVASQPEPETEPMSEAQQSAATLAGAEWERPADPQPRSQSQSHWQSQSQTDSEPESEFESPAQSRAAPDALDEPGDESGLALDTSGYDWQPQEVASGGERQHDRGDEPGLAFELDTSENPGANTSTQTQHKEPPAEGHEHSDNHSAPDEQSENLPPLDTSEFDLDDDGDASSGEDDSADDSDSVAIRLDLARMYLDMEDEGAARELLDEAIAEGTQTQRHEAEKMLAAI